MFAQRSSLYFFSSTPPPAPLPLCLLAPLAVSANPGEHGRERKKRALTQKKKKKKKNFLAILSTVMNYHATGQSYRATFSHRRIWTLHQFEETHPTRYYEASRCGSRCGHCDLAGSRSVQYHSGYVFPRSRSVSVSHAPSLALFALPVIVLLYFYLNFDSFYLINACVVVLDNGVELLQLPCVQKGRLQMPSFFGFPACLPHHLCCCGGRRGLCPHSRYICPYDI